MLPLYQAKEHSFPPLEQANKGLRFEKLFNQYSVDWDVESDAKTKFLGVFKGACGDKKQLERATIQQMSLSQSQQGNGKVYHLDGHFVTGMGNSHPVENGFLWHHTLGVPYLSGSQVKGLVRSLIEQYYQADDRDEILLQWFGSINKGNVSTSAGDLIFFDAIPTEQPTLTVDIMTPHQGKWYSDGGKITDINNDKIPADWHDPTPIPFLAVKKASFLFGIAKRPNSDIDINDVFTCLDKALSYCGAGAKTQTGYGFMSFDKKSTDGLVEIITEQQQKREKEKALQDAKANASELQAQLLDNIAKNNWRESNDAIKQHFTDSLKSEWIERLENNADDKGCIELFFEIANIHYAKQIKNPHNKKVKEHQREWILRLLKLVEENK
ncbi:MAG: type III-B CRISPR module RAMP protein Cmr6 [Gammaproteobacteria bacterium]|nr:type III-B CRISPR module RAMP protein Cmr6 [Gammaproteobacteria bacterium]